MRPEEQGQAGRETTGRVGTHLRLERAEHTGVKAAHEGQSREEEVAVRRRGWAGRSQQGLWQEKAWPWACL